jgi:flagellar hook-length control protein FliK
MFVSVWELLAEARSSAQAVATATDAQRDFWLAETDLQLALTGTSPGAAEASASAAAPTSTTPASH